MAEVKRRVDAVHTVRYGYCSEQELAEIVSIRTSVSGAMPKPALRKIGAGAAKPAADAGNGVRSVYFSGAGGWVDTPTFQREQLRAGNAIAGPALIEEYASTTVVFPGDRLSVDPFGNLSIEVANG